jgi:hypothetical protein
MTPPHYERLLTIFIPKGRLEKSSSQMPTIPVDRSNSLAGCELPKSSPVSIDESAQHFIEFRGMFSVRLLKMPT